MHNINIERSVLASFMFNPELFYSYQEKLSSDDFYLPAHRYMYEAICKIVSEDKPIDDEFIKIELDKQQRFDEDAMLEILSTTPMPSIEAYIDELRSKSQQREIASLSAMIRKMQSEKENVHDILGHIAKKVDEISDKNCGSNIASMIDIADEFHEKFIHIADEKEKTQDLKSGIVTLDNIIGSFEPGDLVIVCARPSMGKTSFATTITNLADKRGIGVLFDSMEMTKEKLFRRLLVDRSGENLNDIKRGLVKNPEKFNKALRELRNTKNIILHDKSLLTIHQLVAKATSVFRKNPNIKYWFIDHLRYIKKDGVNISNEISDITKMIKKVAKEYGVVAFALSQLNRANEARQNKRPQLSDLRESGAVEEDADIVIAPHRESYYNRNDPSIPELPINEAELGVIKNRDGECNIAKCWFYGPSTSFSSIPPITVHDYREPKIEMGVI